MRIKIEVELTAEQLAFKACDIYQRDKRIGKKKLIAELKKELAEDAAARYPVGIGRDQLAKMARQKHFDGLFENMLLWVNGQDWGG